MDLTSSLSLFTDNGLLRILDGSDFDVYLACEFEFIDVIKTSTLELLNAITK